MQNLKFGTKNNIARRIAELEAQKPSRFASFNIARVELLEQLQKELYRLEQLPEDVPHDSQLQQILEAADAASRKNRARDRWC